MEEDDHKEIHHKLTHTVIIILIAVVAINYIVLPLVSVIKPIKLLELPQAFWNLITIIVPSHLAAQVVHAHVPKIISKIKSKDKDKSKE